MINPPTRYQWINNEISAIHKEWVARWEKLLPPSGYSDLSTRLMVLLDIASSLDRFTIP